MNLQYWELELRWICNMAFIRYITSPAQVTQCVCVVCVTGYLQDVRPHPGWRRPACQSHRSEIYIRQMQQTGSGLIKSSLLVQLYIIFQHVFVRSCVCDCFLITGPKGVINDWRRFKLDSVDQTVPQNKRELLRQMSTPREDDKERVNRKVEGNTHTTSHTLKHYIYMCFS